MMTYWTWLDLEINCLHENSNEWTSIQVGDGDNHIVECPECKQEYLVEMIVIPVFEIPLERLEILYD